MRKTLCLLIVILTQLGCNQLSTAGNNSNEQEQGQLSISNPHELLLLPDAEKILGEPGHLTDSATTVKDDVTTYSCAYTANATDAKSGKTGVIYFLLEQYKEVSAAEKKYSYIMKANKPHGIKELDDLGDEAYFHSDNQNFYFIMVRKGAKVFNMKVNKITSNTSLVEFNSIARKVTEAL